MTGKRVIPNVRCLKCHGDENERTEVRDDGSIVEIYVPPHQFEASLHGDQMCTDCHASHEIDSPQGDPVMLRITESCGNCHEDAQRTYRRSYHAQANRLGHTHPAKGWCKNNLHMVRP